MVNAYIPEYGPANRFNHDPLRPKKLLLHHREIKRLTGKIQERGLTLIPTKVLMTDKGLIKVELALAPSFRDDFRESLYRLVGALGATGVTLLMTVESSSRWSR